MSDYPWGIYNSMVTSSVSLLPDGLNDKRPILHIKLNSYVIFLKLLNNLYDKKPNWHIHSILSTLDLIFLLVVKGPKLNSIEWYL